MQLDKLKERSSFLYGDMNLPTPGKLCLIKLTENYLKRTNRKFDTPYIIGELKLNGAKKPIIYWTTKNNNASYFSKEIQCSWTNNIVEKWYYIEDIEKLL